MRLHRRIALKGQLQTLTGLHIGAGKDNIEIGGIDAPVVKHPHPAAEIHGVKLPYIPGSSLKGKLRCLMEWAHDCVAANGKVWEGRPDDPNFSNDPILRIFGTTQKTWKAGPTRLIVRDAFLNPGWARSVIERGLSITEEKFENNIDRIQGKAGQGIRKIERVPAGALFDIDMIFRVFDTGDGGKSDEQCLDRLLEIMKLLEHDALGGSGSRGYGRIKFNELTIDGENCQARFDLISSVTRTASKAA